jgi:hypothetical protein
MRNEVIHHGRIMRNEVYVMDKYIEVYVMDK